MRRTILPALAPALLVAASAAVVRADDTGRISVGVKGQATAVADTVEVELTVSARADESVDAERKFRGKLGSLLAALKEGKAAAKPVKKEKPADKGDKPAKKPADDDDDAPREKPAKKDDESSKAADDAASAIPIELSERALAFGVKAAKDDANPFKAIARMGGAGGAPAQEPPMAFSCKVVATIKGVKKLDPKTVARRVAQVIDLAIDSGADGTDSSTAPVVRFLIDDMESVRTKAYEDAMTKARGRAEKLAKLGGRALGVVHSVHEGTSTGKVAEDLQTAQLKAVQNMFGSSGAGGEALTGFEVSIEVDLSVEFEMAVAK